MKRKLELLGPVWMVAVALLLSVAVLAYVSSLARASAFSSEGVTMAAGGIAPLAAPAAEAGTHIAHAPPATLPAR